MRHLQTPVHRGTSFICDRVHTAASRALTGSWAQLAWIGVFVIASMILHAGAYAATGKTPGSFTVSAAGSATYSIPIWAPPGPHKLQPNLAIVYNHRNGVGSLGPGWSLAGLSAITRCNKTLAEDGAAAPVTLTYNDVFCLDGQRLRLTSSDTLSTYGQDGTTYQTELANFSNATAHGTQGNGPASFTVQGKNGLTYEYGNGGNSQVKGSDSALTAVEWFLDKVTDRSGNTMTAVYLAPSATLAGTTLPSSISWTPTSHAATTYSYSMQFTYTTNLPQSSIAAYVAGTAVLNQDLLTNIQIKNASGTVLKNYVLTYDTAPMTAGHRLSTVKECADAAATDCLLPTSIGYQAGATGLSTSSSSFTMGSNTNWYLANYDFNGDGYGDLLYQVGTTWFVAFGSATGYGAGVSTGVSTPTYVPLAPTLLVGDLRGAGKAGLLANNGGTWFYYTWNGSAFSGITTSIPFDTTATAFALADTNGDGLPDLVSLQLNPGGVAKAVVNIRLNTSSGSSVSFGAANVAYTNTDSGGTAYSTGGFHTMDEQHAGSLHTLDFNGDGRDDLMLALGWNVGTVHIHDLTELLGNGSTFAAVRFSTDGTAPRYVNWNNDGCTDFINGSSLIISACNGNAGATIALGFTPLTTLDWDGDGRTDLVYGSGSTLSVLLSNGTGQGATITTSIPWNTSAAYNALDVNADGLDDLAAWTGTALTYFLHNGTAQPPDLVTSITDGYGIAISPQYVSILRGSYSNSANATSYPEEDIHAPIYVVSSVSQSDGIGGSYTESYSYIGARRNIKGLGFEGFESLTAGDSRAASLIVKTTNQQLFPFTGMPSSVDTFQHNGTTVVSHASYTNQDTVLHSIANNDRHFPHVQSSTVQTREVGGTLNGALITTTSTTNTFDNSGNLTNVATTVTDNDSTSPNLNLQWTTTRATTFFSPDTGANWCLNVPIQTTVTNTAPNVPSITRTTSFDSTADVINCRVNQIVIEPNSSLYKVTHSLSYDAFGNVSTVTTTGTSMTARVSTVDWGTTGQFPMTLRDPVSNALGASGYKTVKGYDLNLGVQTSEVVQSADGTANNAPGVSWQYDEFARKKLETRADGTSTDWVYTDCATGTCLFGSHALTVTSHLNNTDGTVQTSGVTYFDQLDRPVVTTSLLLANGTSTRSDVQYDNFGRVQRRSMPCLWSTLPTYCPYASTYGFDALGRVTQTQRPISASNPTLQTETMQYGGRTTTSTDPNGKITTKISTVAGTLYRSQDHDGYYQQFGYDAFGSLLSVTDSLLRTLFTGDYDYGIRAFQRDATDMDLDVSTAAGQHRHFNYDALGELTSWSDAKGQNFSASYDALSRPLTRTEPDLTTNWTWGHTAANHDVGQLTVVSANGYTETSSFDAFARLGNRSVTIPSDATYGYDLAYNPTTGRLNTLTYPTSTSSYRLTLSYSYQNGILFKVSDANSSTVFWQADTTNARGQISQETLGNGVVTNRAFDDVTGWLSSMTSGLNGTSALQNESYLFDEVGNLIQRQNNNAGLTENFFYDDVYRLDHSNLNGTVNLQMHYTADGNISSRSDLAGGATWTYDPTHQHAVTQAGSAATTYTYDANGNAMSRNGLGISWTSYNHPLVINNTGNGESVQFAYTHTHERWSAVLTSSSGVETTFFIGGLLEKVNGAGTTDYRHYIFAGGTKVAIYSRTSGGVNTLHYVREDHLGSAAAILNSDGTNYVKESFSAFGARRSACTWSGTPTNGQLTKINAVTRHGYTWQTALGTMGLNDMNGRIQDAITGRFLSADPTIPHPGITQSYNRYSYALNNPLTFTDPTGFEDEPEYKTQRDGNDSSNGDNGTLEEVVVTSERTPGGIGSISGGAAAASGSSGSDDSLETVIVTGHRQGKTTNTKPSDSSGDKRQGKQQKTPCPTSGKGGSFASRFKDNFNAANNALKGGVGLVGRALAGAKVSDALFGTPSATLVRWWWSGGAAIATETGTMSVVGSAAAVGATTVVTNAAVALSFEAGNAVGSAVSAISIGNQSVTDWITDAFSWYYNLGPMSDADELKCGW